MRSKLFIATSILFVSCASSRMDPRDKEFAGRTDCRGTAGTGCFAYFKRRGGDADVVCRAESPFPASSRRADCFNIFGRADRERVDPGRLADEGSGGASQSEDAVRTLLWQASAGDAESLAALRRLTSRPSEIPLRAEALVCLAKSGDADASRELGREALARASREWFSALASVPSAGSAPYFAAAILSPNPEVAHLGLEYGQRNPNLPRADFWRSALLAARQHDPADCRRRLREELGSHVAETVAALLALRKDRQVGATATALVDRIADYLPEWKKRRGPLSPQEESEVAFWARAGRLPPFLPGLEEERELRRAESAREAKAYASTRFGEILRRGSDEAALYWTVDVLPSGSLLAEVQAPDGSKRWLMREAGGDTPHEACDPLPGKCEAARAPYLVFRDHRKDPVFRAPGVYRITVESAYRGFRFGPVEKAVP